MEKNFLIKQELSENDKQNCQSFFLPVFVWFCVFMKPGKFSPGKTMERSVDDTKSIFPVF